MEKLHSDLLEDTDTPAWIYKYDDCENVIKKLAVFIRPEPLKHVYLNLVNAEGRRISTAELNNCAYFRPRDINNMYRYLSKPILLTEENDQLVENHFRSLLEFTIESHKKSVYEYEEKLSLLSGVAEIH